MPACPVHGVNTVQALGWTPHPGPVAQVTTAHWGPAQQSHRNSSKVRPWYHVNILNSIFSSVLVGYSVWN